MKKILVEKKALTTAELMVAILLLGTIMVIILPIIGNTITEQRKNLYDIQIENIKKGAIAWGGQNVYLMPTNNGDSIAVSLGELKSKGFVEGKLINPKTEDIFPDNILITIALANDAYIYNVDDSIVSDVTYDPEAPFIVLNGGSNEYVELNGTYVEKGAHAHDKNGNKIENINITIAKEGTIVSNVLTSSLSTYVITYTATDLTNGKSSSVSRNVIVHDTKAPVILVNGLNINHTTVVKLGSNFVAPIATVTDNSGETLTATVIGRVDTNIPDTYELIYEAIDSSGNIGRMMLTVIVKDLGNEIYVNYSVNTSLWTNGNVTVTIIPLHINPLASAPYSFDGGLTWQKSNTKTYSSNQVVRMQARDIEGKASNIVQYAITNIDKAVPICNITGNPTSWAISANLTINTNDIGSGISGIKIPGSTTYSAVTSSVFTVTNNGNYTATVRDVAGNTATCSTTVTKIDENSPTCIITGNPTSWVRNATLTITGSDLNESGVVGIRKPGESTYTEKTSTLYTVTSNGNYMAYVKDAVGRIGTCSVNVTKVDNTAPTIPVVTLKLNSTTGSNYTTDTWTNNNVVQIPVSNDTQSGIKKYQYSYDKNNWMDMSSNRIVNWEENRNYYIRAIDNVDNISAVSNMHTIKIDKTIPSCAISGNPTSWVTNATLKITGNDSLSGVFGIMIPGSSTYVNETITNFSATNNGNYTATVRDKAGNTATCSTTVTKVDKTSPTCTITGNPTSWVKTATLTITGSDLNESGVVGIRKPGESTYTEKTSTPYTVTSNGNYMAYVKDAVGRIGTCSIEVTRVDSVVPTIVSVAGGSSSWIGTSRTLTVTASDATSGIIKYEYRSSTNVNDVYSVNSTSTNYSKSFAPSAGLYYDHYYQFRVTDAAGNVSDWTTNSNSSRVRVDKKPPVCETEDYPVSITAWTNTSRTITGNCTDGESGCSANKISQTFTTEGVYEGSPGAVSDRVGNSTVCPTKSVLIDKTVPTCGTVTGQSTTWTRNNRTISVVCVAGSGSPCYPNTTFKSDFMTSTKTSTIKIMDIAGNEAYCPVNVYVDKENPTCSTSGGNPSWTNGNRIITGTCSDTGGSGCAANISHNFTTNINTTTAGPGSTGGTGTVSDVAGNTATCTANQNIRIDKTNPTGSITVNGGNTYTKTPIVTASLTASDTYSGVYQMCVQTSSAVGSCSWETYRNTKQITLSAPDGTKTVYAWLKDNAGNISATYSDTVILDTTNPTYTITGASTTWTNGNRTITVSCADTGGSGCIKPSYSSTFSTTTQTSSIAISDAAGNTINVPINVYVDKSTPSCGTIAGASTTWTKNNRTISVACSDSGSGCSSSIFSQTFSSDTLYGIGNITITDKVGNSRTCSVNAYVDKTAPTCGSITGASTTWTSSNRTISVGCNDGDTGSDCSQTIFSNIYSATTQTSSITVSDQAGNTRACSVNVYVDKTAPSCTAGGGTTTWTTGNVTVTGACSDGQSGCTTSNISQTFTNEGNYLGTAGTITDKAGNSTVCPAKNVLIDRTAPSCGSVTGASTSWTNSNRNISVGCSDSGSGCSASSFSKTFSSTTTTSSVVIRDNLANERYCPVNVYVDKTAPSCTAGGGTTTWTTGNVTVTGACNDGQSGCTTSNISQTFTNEGNYLGTAGTVTDKAGNSTVCPAKNVLIDRTAPTCGGITGASTSWTGSDRTISVGCSDTGSGCSSSTFSKTFSSTTTASSVVIRDNLANERYCSVNVYVDKTPPACSFTGSSNWDISTLLTVYGSDVNSGIYQVSPGTGYITGSSASRSVSATGTYTAYTKDYVGNTNSCTRYVSSRSEYRYRTCSTCSRCSAAGISYYNYGSWSYSTKICTSSSTPYPTKSEAESKGLTLYYSSCVKQSGTGNGCKVGQYYCSKYTRSRTPVYNRSCNSCGCSTWGEWGIWTTTYEDTTSSKQRDSRTTYSAG